MNIFYIHQYFKTPNEPGGTRSYWIAKELIEKGHRVTIITTKSGIRNKIERCNIDGINIVYVRIPYDQRMGVFQRMISFVRFMLMSTYLGWKEELIDLVVSTSTPLTVGFPALVLKRLRRVPYIFEVRDLWPEVPIQMGAIKSPFLIKFARWFERLIYRNAQCVIALSPGIQDGVANYIPREKTFMIPNMAKISEFQPKAIDLNLLALLGLEKDTFKVIHFGSLGLANGAEYIVEAAVFLRGRKDIEFLFVGGGSTEENLKKRVKDLGLDNVRFLGAFPMSQTSEIVNFCDVSVVSFRDIPILYTNSPNKLFDSLSAGKPIIVNSRGWTKELVEQEDCGFFVDPQNPKALADCVVFLRENPSIVKNMGLNSRRLAEDRFDKSILCRQFAEIVEVQKL